MNLETQKQLQTTFYDDKYADVRRVVHRLDHEVFRYYDERLIECARMPRSAERILDLACGQGGDAILLADRAREVVGVDISRAGLEAARRLAAERYQKKNVTFLTVDGDRLPFGDATFDVVFCKDALHHVADPAGAVREVHRVLRPGGQFIAIEANPLSPQMAAIGLVFYSVDKGVFSNTRRRLTGFLAQAGFREIEFERTEYFPRAIVFYYISPFNRVRWLAEGVRKYERLERWLDRVGVFRLFANYLILRGVKDGPPRGRPGP